ncbi:hypothetical protein [Thioclava sp. DLFJ4-1]|uniref:hypothetical protein n=1 Tax=Thioclava sp. DLFJ4-1 TaxID=1915313 RepID=UPI000996B373|nr:hypothetical protein [Thioclava sp. DLFJ4-1]OOY15059.1 hypothetical protein BMI85_16045 [Thioclava sp. DLFJ4-1]
MNNQYAPIARIALRYVIGGIIGAAQADMLAGDPDLVTVLAMAIGALVEALYAIAKKKGWAT